MESNREMFANVSHVIGVLVREFKRLIARSVRATLRSVMEPPSLNTHIRILSFSHKCVDFISFLYHY